MQHTTFTAAAEAANHLGVDLHQRITLSIAGVLCAAAAIVLMIKRSKWRRTQAVLMLVTGLSMAGAAGHFRSRVEHYYTSGSRSVSAWLLGVGVPSMAALILVLWFVLEMDLDGAVNKLRKNSGATNKHKAGAVTPWLALLVPLAWASLPWVGGVPDAIVAQIG